jgi:hypothetical protein
MAILIRPNLAPLAALVVAAAAAADPPARLRRAALCAAAALPGLAALAAIQLVRYGSPLASGYGPARDLFSAANVAPNWSRYTRWLTATHTPFVWLWILSPLWIRTAAARSRPLAWIGGAFVVGVWLAYLPYVYFRPEEWFYSRFLLPALPLMLLLGTATLLWLFRAAAGRAAAPAAVACTAALAVALGIRASRAGAFDLWRAEAKYPLAGQIVRAQLPRDACVIAMQHSGSIRYYSHRPTLRWDVLDPAWLDRALHALRAAGYEPYAVLDPDEVVAFRNRFAPAGQQSIDRLVPVAAAGRTQVFRVTPP